jgi:hypothetical protein
MVRFYRGWVEEDRGGVGEDTGKILSAKGEVTPQQLAVAEVARSDRSGAVSGERGDLTSQVEICPSVSKH